MKIINRRRQAGAFAIELAFVLVALCAIFLFATDLSHQLLVRAQLDRTSFALVNILKERTRYYSTLTAGGREVRETLNALDVQDMQALAARMLNTTNDQVAIKIEAIVKNVVQPEYASAAFSQLHCQPDAAIVEHQNLIPVENGKVFPLYQVTVCAKVDTWFMPFFGEGKKHATISSSSVIPGR